MMRFFKNLFSKDEKDIADLPEMEKGKFYLKIDDLDIAILECRDGIWHFQYTEEFKKSSDKYSPIIGFPDLDKEYKSELLWPFFRIRIPGLKQPAIQTILQKENIDEGNEVALLKRFGKKTISNPYELVY